MATLFDPPKYDNPQEIIGLILTVTSIPILVWQLYRLVTVYRTKRTWFIVIYISLTVLNLTYELLAVYTNYITTNVSLTVLRTYVSTTSVIFVAFVVREIVSIFSVADSRLPSWTANAVLGMLLAVFFAFMPPRYFLYISYVSTSEKSFIARWGSYAFLNPLLTMAINEVVFIYALYTLYRRRASIRLMAAENNSTKGANSTASSGSRRSSMIRRRSSTTSRGAKFPKGHVSPWFCCFMVYMNAGDVAIINVAINIFTMMLLQFLLTIAMNTAAQVGRPAPSVGWRMAQQYFAMAGFANSMISVLIWDVVQGLKTLLLSERVGGSASAASGTTSTVSHSTPAPAGKTIASKPAQPPTVKSAPTDDN
ncbi:hypothetical protein BC831DRAFT_458857 [Entophlyctis helioformis]|nr:hypothetical protein BC831DRAFT_458857 [Entophlyctis helioformis]